MKEIVIKRVEPILAASIRKSFPSSKFDEELEMMWSSVNEYIDSNGGKRTIPCMMLYHIGWEEMDETKILEVEVVEPITKLFSGNVLVSVYELPAVEKMVCIVHKGPFSTIYKTNEVLFDWISKNGYEKNGPMREIYHKGDWATEDQNEYITEIQVPIK